MIVFYVLFPATMILLWAATDSPLPIVAALLWSLYDFFLR